MPTRQPSEIPTVFIIDDDASLRESLASLFRSVGMKALAFGSAAEFLRSEVRDTPGCMVLDVRLPGLSGLDFQEELARSNISVPIVFITGHGDIPMSVRAMKAGAVEFLTKPFRDQDLLDAVSSALEKDRAWRNKQSSITKVRTKYDSLTPREKEVMALVATGLMNKQIAGELGISEITVKVHRCNAMHKMAARSVADLVRMADLLELGRPASSTA